MIPYIIGFAGCSGSGKSTAVELVAEHFRAAGIETSVMPTDSYYRDQSNRSPEERATVNYDEPAVVDLELLRENLIKLRRGTFSVPEPRYDFKTHTRKPDSVLRTAKPVMIVDGLFAFMVDEGESVLNYRVFIDTTPEKCLERRIERDISERGRTRESVKEQWKATVQPGYVRHVLPQKARADIALDWDHAVEENAEKGRQLFNYLNRLYQQFRTANP